MTGDELDTSLILSKQTPKSAKIADQNTSKPGGQTLKSASTVGQDKSTVNQDRNNVDGNESGGAGAEISSLVLTPTPKARKRNRRRDKIITSADFSLSQTNATAGQSELQVRKAFVLDGSLPSFLKGRQKTRRNLSSKNVYCIFYGNCFKIFPIPQVLTDYFYLAF